MRARAQAPSADSITEAGKKPSRESRGRLIRQPRIVQKSKSRGSVLIVFRLGKLLLSGTIFRVVGIFLDGSNLEFFFNVIILNRIDIEFFAFDFPSICGLKRKC